MVPELKPKIYAVGANDWDRRLFDALIAIPDGTSYNSYLVVGSDKTALIDAVEPTQEHVLMRHLDELKPEKIDYIVSQHAEQDHSGTIPAVLARYPHAQVLSTPKGKGMLVDLLLLPEAKITTVNDGETVSLGDRTLEFIHASWVHWPETMFTYVREEKLLFTCDLFGSHLASSCPFVVDEGRAYQAAKRYYAEIMMPFHTNIQRHLERLKPYDIKMIATSHGPAYDKPEFILKAYRSWVFDPPWNLAVVAYVSMHGSTHHMVDYLVEALTARGVLVQQFDLSAIDLGRLAMALVDAATLVIGTPTVLASMHPTVAYAAFLANLLRPKLKYLGIIGSYGWGGRTVEQLTGMVSTLKAELLEPVIARGFPKEADFRALDKLADAIASKHKEAGLSN